MKSAILLILTFLFCSLNAFSVENGRGVFKGRSLTSIQIRLQYSNETKKFTADSTMPVELINGEIVPFNKLKSYWNMILNFEYEGNQMLSASVDRGKEFGENYTVGVLDVIDTTNKVFRVSGLLFKTTPENYKFIQEQLVTNSLKSKSDLVSVVYLQDSTTKDNFALEINIEQGGYRDFNRTGIVRNTFFNEFTIGDPIDTSFQEKFILHSTTKIYDENFNEVSKSQVIPGKLLDVYAYYDTNLVRNFVYELHLKDIPIHEDVSIIGKGISLNTNHFSSELGVFSILPTAQCKNLQGDDITINALVENDVANYSFQLSKRDTLFEINAIKELPILQRESTFEGVVAVYDSTQNTYLGRISKSGIPPRIAVNRFKTYMKDFLFEDLPEKFVRFTARKGSNSNFKLFMYNDVMAIEKPSTTESIFIGLVTDIKNTYITINNLKFLLDSNCKFVTTNGIEGTLKDIRIGDYVVIDLQLTAKTVYKFNPLEVIGRISNIQNNQITVGSFTFPTGEFTFYRGQGNQVTELDKILPNSLVKVVSLHGSTEAIAKFAGKTFPSNTATIARFVYVLHGPDPVSTNESVVTPMMFPNPSSTVVTVTTPAEFLSEVTISTMLGEQVYTKSNVTGKMQFSTSSLPIGQYIVKISNNKSTTNQILQVIR